MVIESTLIKDSNLKSRPNSGVIAVMGAAILWSLDGLLRRNLYSVAPSIVVLWEHLFGVVLLAPIVIWKWQEFKKFSKKQILAIVVVAFLSGALGTIFYTAALGKVNFIQFSVVVLLQQLQPIFAITAGILVMKEKITSEFIRLALLALGAAYFVSFPNLQVNIATGAGTVIAALLAVGAAISWGSSTALSKYALQNTSFLHTTFLRFIITPVFALLFVGILKQSASLIVISQTQWLNLISITLSTGAVALALYYWGLKRTPVRVTTIAELTWPVSAILIDFFVFHKTLTATQWFGAFVLLAVIHRVTLIKR